MSTSSPVTETHDEAARNATQMAGLKVGVNKLVAQFIPAGLGAEFQVRASNDSKTHNRRCRRLRAAWLVTPSADLPGSPDRQMQSDGKIFDSNINHGSIVVRDSKTFVMFVVRHD